MGVIRNRRIEVAASTRERNGRQSVDHEEVAVIDGRVLLRVWERGARWDGRARRPSDFSRRWREAIGQLHMLSCSRTASEKSMRLLSRRGQSRTVSESDSHIGTCRFGAAKNRAIAQLLT